MTFFLSLAGINLFFLIINVFNHIFRIINYNSKKNFFFSTIEYISVVFYFFTLIYYFLLSKKLPNNSVEILFFLNFIIYLFFGKNFLFFFQNNLIIKIIILSFVIFVNCISLFGLYHLLQDKSFSLPFYSSIYYLLYFFLIISILFYCICYFYSFLYRQYFLQLKYKKKKRILSLLPNIFTQEQMIEKFLILANLTMSIFLFSLYFIFVFHHKQISIFINVEHFFLFFAWLLFCTINIYQKIKRILPQNFFFILSMPIFILLIFLFFLLFNL